MDKKKKIALVITGIMLALTVAVGVSYALWTKTRTQREQSKLASGCFSLTLVDGERLDLSNEYPLTDEDGLRKTPYTFQIQNTCTIDAYVTIKFMTTTNTTMNLEHIKVALAGDATLEPKILSSSENGTTETANIANTKILTKTYVPAQTTNSYELRIWLDESVTKEEEQNTRLEAKIEIDGEAAKIPGIYADKSGANVPELNNGLIPVVYENNTWVKADLYEKWYDYKKQWWANAVTVKEENRENYLNADPGTEIPMSDINTMWVWVPRYSYSIKSEGGGKYTGKNTGTTTYCRDIENPNPTDYSECYEYDMSEESKQIVYNTFVNDYKKMGVTVELAQIMLDSWLEYGYNEVLDSIMAEQFGYDAFPGAEYTATFHPEYVVVPKKDAPGEIDVKFISKDTKDSGTARYTSAEEISWYTHPAFTFGEEELSGMWFAKFKISTGDTTCTTWNGAVGTYCDLTTIKPTIIPNATAWTGARVGTFFTTIQNQMNDDAGQTAYGISNSDVHMTKNIEWGAVAYLTQSKYGKYANRNYTGENRVPYLNYSQSNQTGNSNGSVSLPYGWQFREPQYTYEEDYYGVGASTTGTIYGIYDVSGCTREYVMGVMKEENNTEPTVGYSDDRNSGFKGFIYHGQHDYPAGDYEYLKDIDAKYYDVYNYMPALSYNGTDAIHAYTRGHLGDANKEVFAWYKSSGVLPNEMSPWVTRGGSGFMLGSRGTGESDSSVGTRAVLVSK